MQQTSLSMFSTNANEPPERFSTNANEPPGIIDTFQQHSVDY